VTQNYQTPGPTTPVPGRNVFTRYRYDAAAGRVRWACWGYTPPRMDMTRSAADTVTDPLTHTITRTYNFQGQLVATCDANGDRTRYGYDALAAPWPSPTADEHDVLCLRWIGRRTLITDAAGIVTRYQYDLLGRLITVTENYSPTEPADAQNQCAHGLWLRCPGQPRTHGQRPRVYTTYAYDEPSPAWSARPIRWTIPGIWIRCSWPADSHHRPAERSLPAPMIRWAAPGRVRGHRQCHLRLRPVGPPGGHDRTPRG